MYEKSYFTGKTSNYLFGYKVLNNKFFWRKIIKRMLKLKEKGSLLDIGCAYGYFLKYASKHFKVKGIDISKHAIKIAKKEIGKENALLHDVMEKLPFKKKFDLITAFDVIEHLPNQEKALKNIKNVLKKDGYLLIEMPLKYDNKIVNLLQNDTDKTHEHLMTYQAVKKLIKKTGLKIISEENYLAVARSMIQIKTKKPKNLIKLVIGVK